MVITLDLSGDYDGGIDTEGYSGLTPRIDFVISDDLITHNLDISFNLFDISLFFNDIALEAIKLQSMELFRKIEPVYQNIGFSLVLKKAKVIIKDYKGISVTSSSLVNNERCRKYAQLISYQPVNGDQYYSFGGQLTYLDYIYMTLHVIADKNSKVFLSFDESDCIIVENPEQEKMLLNMPNMRYLPFFKDENKDFIPLLSCLKEDSDHYYSVFCID